jgi:two-component system, NarL family, sensor histidine kinase DegS
MNETESSILSAQYLTELRAHLDRGDPQADLLHADEIGKLAAGNGLETLDLARIHEIALAVLTLPDCSPSAREDMSTRAANFFTEAIIPIERTHRAALEVKVQLEKLSETLDQSALDLADSKRRLLEGITERKRAEAAFKTNAEHSARLLSDSRALEAQLQDVARKILAGNEEERKKMSLQLHDEIAQILLGIHVRLLSLKKEAAANHAGLNEEIATTHRLVEDCVKTIKRFAREFGIQHK